MISLIQFKQVLRNKRFILFTLFIPVTWYMILNNLQDDVMPNIFLSIAIFIGVIGNSLATFSKRISSEIEFYKLESSFSNYNIVNYLLSQSLVQVLLNSLIFVVVTVVAIILFGLPLSNLLLYQFILLMLMGIYFSFIGFVIGVRVDSKVIDTISFPIIVLASITIIPFSQLAIDSDFVKTVSTIQKIFPGYYYSQMINSLMTSREIQFMDLLLFLSTIFINLLPLYLLIPDKKSLKMYK
ncbi:ABC transporter [Streptococcus parauberis]|uniref:ABC transporter permease n=1 Tax=Streptococcus TaxID=1301 RepID=UPI0008FA95D1|nr:ABC transporter permease [Streptococcus parauberis]MCO4487188.1 hypothetical protein [Streptococcus infantarius subsp. infantarius]OHY30674.1 ABC transporter [Streptococcus parauberis]PNY22816.1 ABC-2 type transporter [Streptococcus parauberis]